MTKSDVRLVCFQNAIKGEEPPPPGPQPLWAFNFEQAPVQSTNGLINVGTGLIANGVLVSDYKNTGTQSYGRANGDGYLLSVPNHLNGAFVDKNTWTVDFYVRRTSWFDITTLFSFESVINSSLDTNPAGTNIYLSMGIQSATYSVSLNGIAALNERWVRITVVRGVSDCHLYFDGKDLEPTTAISWNQPSFITIPPTINFLRNAGECWIDCIQVFDEELTPAQIQSLE